jgi:predicted permease
VRLWHVARARLESLIFRGRRESDLAEELQLHVEREAERLESTGLSPEAARRRAARLFGGMDQVKEACRDQRRTAIVDNLARDVRYAFRSFRRAPLAATTIVLTVALGLGLVTVAFTLLNAFLFRADEVPHVHELFAVERPRTSSGERVRLTREQYDALVRETGVFSGAFAMLPDVDSRVDGRLLAGTLVTANFFEVLGVDAALGRPLTQANAAERGAPPVVVLSHRGWSSQFGSDPDVLGKTVLLSGVHFQVVGVMPEGFRGLSVGPPDYWAPLSVLGRMRSAHAGREDRVALDVVGRLRPGLSREQALAQLLVWDTRNAAGRAEDRARAKLVLEPRRGTVPQPIEAWILVAPLFVAFGLILLIGCANVTNLLLARAVARQREIGIRLATGASRGRVIAQLLTENVLLSLGSAAIAFVLSRAVLSGIVHLVTSTMPPDIGDVRLNLPAADWRVALFLLGGALLATMAFALAPAIQATRVELVRAIRGEVVRDARPGRTRNVLIGLQVTASVLLLVCSAVFLRSALDAASVDPGIRTADTIALGRFDDSTRSAILDIVRREPSVSAIAASWPDVMGRPRRASLQGGGGPAVVTYKFVSREFFDVLGVDLVSGRGFSADERSSSSPVAVVSASLARQLWPDGPAVGQVLRLDPDATPEGPGAGDPPLLSRALTVVGVARDVPGLRFADAEPTGVYVPTSVDVAQTSVTVRVHGDPERARRVLLDRITAIDPGKDDVFTLRTAAAMETYFLRIGFWLTLALGALALVLTLSGLFSVLSYLVEQRSREIGVRLALGATSRSICSFVLSQLTGPVGAGLLIGGGLAVAFGGVLLSTPAGAYIGAVVHLFDPIAYVGSLIFVVTSCAAAGLIPALRAARIDPVATLRQD